LNEKTFGIIILETPLTYSTKEENSGAWKRPSTLILKPEGYYLTSSGVEYFFNLNF
jgi:hypothetical protein